VGGDYEIHGRIQSSVFVVLRVKKIYICEQESHVRAFLVKEKNDHQQRLKID
jgi:hypothetical protein